MELLPSGFLYGVVLIFGLCLGSFYNVCVHRYLSGESVVFPPSHCPACGHVLSWWENIPVVSYVMLGARCRSCRKFIHWRYPAVEILAGAIAVLLFWKFGPSLPWLTYMVLSGMFLVASFIDLDSFILPDVLTWPAAGLAVSMPLFLPLPWIDTLGGGLAGAGIFLALQQFYSRVRGIDALGTGDIKLMLSLGAIVGLSGLPLMILLSAVFGLLGAIPSLLRPEARGMRTAIPFGPFLCLGALTTLLWGDLLLRFLI